MTTDIAIVGASASGLLSAHLLAAAGREVQVFERSPQLEPEPRTLIVTSRLQDYLGDLADGSVVNEIRSFELFVNGRSSSISLVRPDLVVERSVLIRDLAEAAEMAGAKIRLGHRFTRLIKNDDGGVAAEFLVDGNPEVIETNAVIGADGAISKVAEAASLPSPATVPLVQAIVDLPSDCPPDVSKVWFRPEDTPYFYWLIPESEKRAAVGIIGEEGAGTRQRLDRFLEQQGLEPISYQAARIPEYRRWTPLQRSFGKGRVYLVGDAAGHVKVSTVGGLVTGFRGAIAVVEEILRGRRSELRRLRIELEAHRLIRRVMHGFEEEDYGRMIDALSRGTKSSLGIHSRDEAARVLWEVGRRQPRLALLAARRLLTGGGWPHG